MTARQRLRLRFLAAPGDAVCADAAPGTNPALVPAAAGIARPR